MYVQREREREREREKEREREREASVIRTLKAFLFVIFWVSREGTT
jgi:hypothetical protein